MKRSQRIQSVGALAALLWLLAGCNQQESTSLAEPAAEPVPVQSQPHRCDTDAPAGAPLPTIEVLWQRLQVHIDRLPEAERPRLRGPASEESIAALESDLGVQLPADYAASLRTHDGQWPGSVELFGGGYGFSYAGTAEVLADHALLTEVHGQLGNLDEGDDLPGWKELIETHVGSIDGPVRAANHRRDWIPIGNSNGDIFRYLDLAPAPHGTVGQLIQVYPESGSWGCLAPSWTHYLAAVADALDAGTLRLGATRDLTAWTDFPAAVDAPPTVPRYLVELIIPDPEPGPVRLAIPGGVKVLARVSNLASDGKTLVLELAGTDGQPWLAVVRSRPPTTQAARNLGMHAFGWMHLRPLRGKLDDITRQLLDHFGESALAFELRDFERRRDPRHEASR